jgi:hypothetical protein
LTGYRLDKVVPWEPEPEPDTWVALPPPDRLEAQMAAARDPQTADRLARVIGPSLSPVFIVAPPYAGAAGLLAALGAHSAVCAPAEMPFVAPHVEVGARPAAAFEQIGIGRLDLDYMLWDRLLRDVFARSHKDLLVLSTTGLERFVNGSLWRHLKVAWPAARYVYLLRDPAMVTAHVEAAGAAAGSHAMRRLERVIEDIRDARLRVPGVSVRYEDLLADSDAVAHEVCSHVGLDPEPAVLESLREFAKSQADNAGQPAASALTEDLVDVAKGWGYR